MIEEKNIIEKPKKGHSNLKTLLVVLVIVAFFGLGWGIGKGKIQFGPDAVYRQSVQKNGLSALDYKEVDQVYEALKQSYDGQLDVNKLNEGLKEGLVRAAGDPYTEYLTTQENTNLSDQLDGSFDGIGAELGKKGTSIVIIAPIRGFPAQKAGLKAGDFIIEINGEDTSDLTISQAVEKIRGKAGSEVKLRVLRSDKPLEFKITRARITIPSVKSKIINGDIGVITVSRFGKDTEDLARQAAKDLKSKQVRGIILDLRGNPGGEVPASIGLASLWLPENTTVMQEKRDGKLIKTLRATGDPVLNGTKTIVLIDEGSASASEIVAGALSDHKTATR